MKIIAEPDPLKDDDTHDTTRDDITTMSAAEANEYLFALLQTLKLTEKDRAALESEVETWQHRVDLARALGRAELVSAAEKEAAYRTEKLAILRKEEIDLKQQIEFTRRKLSGLAARERSVDPDLLQQDLLLALGRTGEDAETEKDFAKIEKESSADAELKALKAKMDSL